MQRVHAEATQSALGCGAAAVQPHTLLVQAAPRAAVRKLTPLVRRPRAAQGVSVCLAETAVHLVCSAGNAVRMAAATVEAVLAAVPAARIVGMRGGDKRNAIARECTATVAVSWGAARRG